MKRAGGEEKVRNELRTLLCISPCQPFGWFSRFIYFNNSVLQALIQVDDLISLGPWTESTFYPCRFYRTHIPYTGNDHHKTYPIYDNRHQPLLALGAYEYVALKNLFT